MGQSNTKLSVKKEDRAESSDSEAEEETKTKTSGDEEGITFLQWQYGELRKEEKRLKKREKQVEVREKEVIQRASDAEAKWKGKEEEAEDKVERET